MKTVYLLRHAKAMPGSFLEDDFERTLNDKGRQRADLIGQYMKDHDMVPEVILSSSAARTAETTERLLPFLGKDVTVQKMRSLYLARASHILSEIWRLDDDTHSTLVVGHNPGIHELAYILTANRSSAEALEIQSKFPTAALAVLEFNAHIWGQVDRQTGALTDVVFPSKIE